MKRKDFMKSCFALGLVPLLPKVSAGKEKWRNPMYGMGFQQKNGIVYGFSHEDNGEVELLIIDYRRVPLDTKLIGKKPPNYGKPTDSFQKKKGYLLGDEIGKELHKLMRQKNDNNLFPKDQKEADKAEKIWSKRLPRWMKRLQQGYPFKGE